MNKNLKSAEKKVSPCSDKKQWCGYLTPSEAIAILNDGAKSIGSWNQIEKLMERKKLGNSSPSWFYFCPSKHQIKRWGIPRQHHKD